MTTPLGKIGTLGESGELSHHLTPTERGTTNRILISCHARQIYPDLLHVSPRHHNLGQNPLRRFPCHTVALQAKARNRPNPHGTVPMQSDQAHHSWSTSSIPKGHIKVSLKDDTQRDWAKKVRLALNSKQRMKAACELTDAEKLQPCIAVDEDKFQAVYHSIRALDRVIPGDVAHLATHLISGSRLLDDIDVSKAHVLDLRTTNMMAPMALVFPLPDISRFSMPEPFKGKRYTTWASIHGTPAEGGQNILKDSCVRPTGPTIQISAHVTCRHAHIWWVLPRPRDRPWGHFS